MVLETASQDQGSELPSSKMIPQMTVVVDLTCSEDELSLKPGYAVGECHAHRLLYFFFGSDPNELTSSADCMVLKKNSRNQGSQLSNSTMTPRRTVVAALTHGDD
jgi:hypothetical protein